MRFLLLMVAAVIAVLAGVAALQLSSKPSTPTQTAAPAGTSQSVSTVDVLVARTPIAAGSIITAAMFDRQPWPENLVLEGFIVSNGTNDEIIGKISRAAFQAREPLISSKLASTTDAGFLAATLPAGMRAVTIATDAVSGVAGFVFPGDHVDILLTHNIPQDLKAANSDAAVGSPGAGAIDKPAFAEILVANVPVLATNIRENASGGDAAAALSSGASSISPSSMTLQVTDSQAEKIRLGEKVGTISLSLRSLKDKDNANLSPPTNVSGLTRIGLAQSVQDDGSVKVVRGAAAGASGGQK